MMNKNNIQFLSGGLSSSERSEGRIEARSRRTVLQETRSSTTHLIFVRCSAQRLSAFFMGERQ